jgi:predicted aconitase with swiveling domain
MLNATPKMRSKECFRHGRKRASILRSTEAMAFIGIVDVSHGDTMSLHRLNDLLGL